MVSAVSSMRQPCVWMVRNPLVSPQRNKRSKISQSDLGVTTGLASPSFPYFAMESFIFLQHMEAPELVPIAVEVGGSEIQHRLRAGRQPAHPGPLHPILHQMTT